MPDVSFYTDTVKVIVEGKGDKGEVEEVPID